MVYLTQISPIQGFALIFFCFFFADEKTKDTKITASSETILHGLKKYTNYSMEVLTYTSGGDGVRTSPIACQTEQDGKLCQALQLKSLKTFNLKSPSLQLLLKRW